MKKLILIPVLLFSFLGVAQLPSLKKTSKPADKTSEYLTKAKSYLDSDVCNNTGLDWAKSALDVSPDNTEAKQLIYRCDNHKYNQAVSVLQNDLGNIKSRTDLEALVKLPEFNTEIANSLLANFYLERGNYKNSENYINRAIELNPANLEYRWIRSRCNLTNYSKEDEFNKAISDLHFMIDNGVSTLKIYKALGVAEYELAGFINRSKKAKENTGFSDDNSAYIKEQTAYYNEAINHYEESIKAYKKAIEIDASEAESLSYKVKDAEKYIQEVREKIKQLK